MKKVLVIVIATILALSVIGTCFALYKINATDRNITLTTGDAVTLSIAAGDLAEVGISPDHTTATYNVTALPYPTQVITVSSPLLPLVPWQTILQYPPPLTKLQETMQL